MGKVLDATERLWTGTAVLEDEPWLTFLGLEQVADQVAFVASFANVTAFATGEGALVVDTGSPLTGAVCADAVRTWLREQGHEERVHTIVLTHGHVDHVMGIGAFEAGTSARVIAHHAVPERFDRYRLTRGYNEAINKRQFRLPSVEWPKDYRYPDVTYERSLALTLSGVRFELAHDRGETDDHTWVWVPERGALCTGDLFIWASPNCGNPQKVQRYPREWAHALRKMASLDASILLPGHGPPIVGRDRVRRALEETAELLETLVDQTLAWMNEGAPLDVVLQRVRVPERLLLRPYLRPIYDEPEFVIRNLYRLYGGWWDGDPSELKPAPRGALARELAELAGGARRMMARASELSEIGEHRLACHLAEMAARVDPGDRALRRARAEVYRARMKEETSLMAKSVFRAAADEPPGRGFDDD